MQVGLTVEAPDNSGLVEVVWRHLHFYLVADSQTYPTALAHFAGDMSQHLMVIF